MLVFTFKILFITLGCAIVFANDQSHSAKSLDKYAEKIRAELAFATNIVVADQKDKNSKENIVGSALNGLVLFLKTFLVPALTFLSNTPSYLSNIIGGALDGLAHGGLVGLLGRLPRNAAIGFKEIAGKIGENFLKVSDPTQNEMIRKKIKNAVTLGTAKLDAGSTGRSDLAVSLSYVIVLVGLVLNYVHALLPYLTTVLGSAVSGLIESLVEGLKQKGLIGGLLSGLKGLLDSLGTGATKGFGGFLSNLLA